jgi:hypothetical protein
LLLDSMPVPFGLLAIDPPIIAIRPCEGLRRATNHATKAFPCGEPMDKDADQVTKIWQRSNSSLRQE